MLLLALLTGAAAMGLAGCGGTSGFVTPVGNSTVTVNVAPGSGPAQTLTIGITITQ